MTTLLLLSVLLLQDPVFPDADPQPAIKAAQKKAGENNRVVLVLWGSNDDERSKEVATLLKKDKEIARLMLYEYDLVLADRSKADDATKRGNDKLPLPWMAFVSADGNSVGWWETPKDQAGLVEALKKNQRKPLVAKEVLAAAMKRAAGEKKRVILTFSAPWCGWCHRFAAWMAREDAAVFHKEFVPVKIDIDRMTGGKELLASYPKSDKQGIPWFVFLDADGKELGDSMGEKGNIGCPNQDDEIELFLEKVKKVAVNLTADDLAALRKSLFAAQVKTK